jgi:hypothetical protein
MSDKITLPPDDLAALVRLRDHFVEDITCHIGGNWYDEYKEPGYSIPALDEIEGFPASIVMTDWNNDCIHCKQFATNHDAHLKKPIGLMTPPAGMLSQISEMFLRLNGMYPEKPIFILDWEKLRDDAPELVIDPDDILELVLNNVRPSQWPPFVRDCMEGWRCDARVNLTQLVHLMETDWKHDPLAQLVLEHVEYPAQHEFEGTIDHYFNEAFEGADIDDKEEFIRRQAVHRSRTVEDLQDIGELLCLDTDWLDEWTGCTTCQGAVRTSPDCYSWTRAYIETEDFEETVCHDCCREDPGWYFEQVKNRVTNGGLLGEPDEYGWLKVTPRGYADRWQNGWHPGQNDDPSKQLELLNNNGYDVVFQLHQSQFYVEWEIFVMFSPTDEDSELGDVPEPLHDKVIEHVRELLENCGECKMYPSPAEIGKAYLQDCSRAVAELGPVDGPIHTTMDPNDPTKAVARVLTEDEFVKGTR